MEALSKLSRQHRRNGLLKILNPGRLGKGLACGVLAGMVLLTSPGAVNSSNCLRLSQIQIDEFVAGHRTQVCGTSTSLFRSIKVCSSINLASCHRWYDTTLAKCRQQLQFGCKMMAKAANYGGCVGAEFEKLAAAKCGAQVRD